MRATGSIHGLPPRWAPAYGMVRRCEVEPYCSVLCFGVEVRGLHAVWRAQQLLAGPVYAYHHGIISAGERSCTYAHHR